MFYHNFNEIIKIAERVVLKRFITKRMKQGDSPREIYQIIHDAAREEFTEHNEPTTDYWLREQFEETQYKPASEPRVIIKKVTRRPTRFEINRVISRKYRHCRNKYRRFNS